MPAFLRDFMSGRRSIWVAALTILLCLAISACGSTQIVSQTARPTATQTSLPRNHLPCTVGCTSNGGGDGVSTPTPSPAKLSASPTTIGSWQTCALNTPCTNPGKFYSTVTLSNAGSTSLSWSIGQTTVATGSNGIQFAPASGTIDAGQRSTLVVIVPAAFIQGVQNGTLTHQWFDVVGPVNTVQINLA